MTNYCLDNTKEYIKKVADVDLIFILGKIGSGKDTVAEYLRKRHNFTVLRYGDIIKKMLIEIGWDGQKDIRGRKLLLEIGEAFRKWDENVFVKKMVCLTVDCITDKYNNPSKFPKQSDKKRIVISDVRLPNEIFCYREFLKREIKFKSVKSISIKMIGSNYNNAREVDEEIMKDPTEVSLDSYEADYYILNDQFTNLEDIYEILDFIVKTEFSD